MRLAVRYARQGEDTLLSKLNPVFTITINVTVQKHARHNRLQKLSQGRANSGDLPCERQKLSIKWPNKSHSLMSNSTQTRHLGDKIGVDLSIMVLVCAVVSRLQG
jgi:hypothetical protein